MAANSSVASVDNDVPIQRDNFVCIEYPGRVENVDKMLETLGDEETLSKTISETNKRMELRFRPDDPYCKPLCGNLYPTNNLLVRVKRRYRKPKTKTGGRDEEKAAGTSMTEDANGDSTDALEDVEYKSEVLGVVESTYRFTGLCDFQYLPMHKNEDGKVESLIEKIIPSNIGDTSYYDQALPYHLQPPSFSRSDLPTDYCYKPDQIQHRASYPPTVADTLESNLIGRNRARRPHNAYILAYEQVTIPMEPHPNAVGAFVKYKNLNGKLEELKKLFEKRPLWSKNALKCKIELTQHNFKILLPLAAYYYNTGPWRALWCRLGYDPRKTAGGKQYQMLDFRLRKVMSEVYGKGVIKAKRSTYVYRLPVSIRKPGRYAVTVGKKTGDDSDSKQIPKEAYYVFRRGLIPAYHQMFYQLCDLEDEDLQAIVHANDGSEKVCDERNGWLESDVLSKLRDLITEILKETLINLNKEEETSSVAGEDQPSTSEAAPKDADDNDDEDDADDDDDPLSGDEGDEDGNDDGDDEDDDINEMEMEILEYMDTEET